MRTQRQHQLLNHKYTDIVLVIASGAKDMLFGQEAYCVMFSRIFLNISCVYAILRCLRG